MQMDSTFVWKYHDSFLLFSQQVDTVISLNFHMLTFIVSLLIILPISQHYVDRNQSDPTVKNELYKLTSLSGNKFPIVLAAMYCRLVARVSASTWNAISYWLFSCRHWISSRDAEVKWWRYWSRFSGFNTSEESKKRMMTWWRSMQTYDQVGLVVSILAFHLCGP